MSIIVVDHKRPLIIVVGRRPLLKIDVDHRIIAAFLARPKLPRHTAHAHFHSMWNRVTVCAPSAAMAGSSGKLQQAIDLLTSLASSSRLGVVKSRLHLLRLTEAVMTAAGIVEV